MQKGSVLPFLILIIIAISGIVATYFYFFYKPPSLKSVKIVSQIDSGKKDNSILYRNDNLNFEFKYTGPDIVVKVDSEEQFNFRGNGDFRKNFKGYVGYEPGNVAGVVAVLDNENNFDKNPFTLWVFDNPDEISTEAWFEKYWYYPFLWGVFSESDKGHVRAQNIATISGQTTKYATVSYQLNSPKYLYLSNNGMMYLLRVIGEKGEEILTSFKFLE